MELTYFLRGFLYLKRKIPRIPTSKSISYEVNDRRFNDTMSNLNINNHMHYAIHN
jgi:hypothetical protein